jgi:hypothetical protein
MTFISVNRQGPPLGDFTPNGTGRAGDILGFSRVRYVVSPSRKVAEGCLGRIKAACALETAMWGNGGADKAQKAAFALSLPVALSPLPWGRG